MHSKEIRLLEGRKKAGFLDFMVENDKIMLTSMGVREGFQRKGYGTLLVRALMGIADYFYKPIFVISNIDTINFYKRLGFVCLDEYAKGEFRGQKVIIKNLPKNTSLEEVEFWRIHIE